MKFINEMKEKDYKVSLYKTDKTNDMVYYDVRISGVTSYYENSYSIRELYNYGPEGGYDKNIMSQLKKKVGNHVEIMLNKLYGDVGDYMNLKFVKFVKPIRLYDKKGVAIKMSDSMVSIESFDHEYGSSEMFAYIANGDRDWVKDEMFAANFHEDNFYENFVHSSLTNKLLVYKRYLRFLPNLSAKNMSTVRFKNMKLMKSMHNKAYMKEFNMMNKLGNEFGFFED